MFKQKTPFVYSKHPFSSNFCFGCYCGHSKVRVVCTDSRTNSQMSYIMSYHSKTVYSLTWKCANHASFFVPDFPNVCVILDGYLPSQKDTCNKCMDEFMSTQVLSNILTCLYGYPWIVPGIVPLGLAQYEVNILRSRALWDPFLIPHRALQILCSPMWRRVRIFI